MANKNFKTDITADGDVSGKNLKATNSSANEGGQIELSTPSSGTTLSGTNVTIDVYQDKIRFFESGGTNRGAYIPLTSTGASVGTSLLGGTTGAMNYAQQQATKQSGISSSGVTIVSQSFTTNGYPVQVVVTGDAENSTAGGWVVVQLHRDSTAIGKKVHIEMSAASENVPYALTVIDAPSAGTYTYSLKTVSSVAAGTMNFGETDGPVLTLVELSGPKGDTGAAGSTGDSFKTIAVTGQDSVVADSSTDTLNLVAGTNVSLTTNATTDSITINADSKATSSVYLVRNNTGSTILKGTLVSASGAEPSGRIDVEPFAAVGGINSEITVMGMATANISDGVNGEVISFGTLTGLDTRGDTASSIAVGDETWAEGDILFAHPTVAGKLTKVRPQHDLAVAFITVRHASTGQIAVRIVPGNNHLEWMHDVAIDGTPADNEVLAYDSASGLWINQTSVEAGIIDTSTTAQTKSGDLTVSTKVVTPRIENLADINIVSDAGSGSTNNVQISTRYNNINISDPDSKVIIVTGNDTNSYTYSFGTTGLTFADTSVQSTAFLGISSYDTDDIAEGTNLYYTDERAQDAVGNSLGTGLSYNDSTGAISNSGVTSLTGTENEVSVSASTGGITISIPDSPVFVTPNIGVATATSVNGTTIPTSKTLLITDDISVSIQAYSTTLAGINTLGSGTGFLKNTAGTWSYDNSTYLTTSDASSTYLTQSNASSTYLTQSNASSTYLTQSNASTNYQPKDQDLTDIAALTADGLLKRTSGVWSMDSSTYLTSESDTLETVTDRGATSSNAITISNTTNSTTPTSGALIVSGGVGIAKDVWIDGDLHVNGTTSTLYSSTVATSDNLIYLNQAQDATITNAVGDGTYVTYTADNNYSTGMDIRVTGMDPSGYNISSADGLTIYSATSTQFVVAKTTTGSFVSGGTAHAKTEANADLGFAGGYYNSGYAHAGLFRDASDGIFKFFDGYTPEPDEAVNIDTTDISFSFAPVKVESLDVVDSSTTRTNLGLAIGTDVQAYNSTLAAVAGGTYAGDDSITTVGTISSGTWNGTALGYAYGGTGLTSLGTAGQVLTVNAGATAIEWATPSGGGGGGLSTTTTSITANTATAIESFAIATSRTAEAIIQITQGTDYYSSKVLLIHDGTTVKITEYAILESTTGAIPVTISAAITGSDLELLATITDAETTNATAKVVLIEVAV